MAKRIGNGLWIYEQGEDFLVVTGYCPNEVYDKSEADEYIGELKKERDWLAKDRAQAYDDLEKRAQLNIKQEESIRHQKYKRCLAMAKWCFTKSNYHFVLARHGEDGKENNRRSILYSKWYKRWLKIAEKFKTN